MGLIFGVCSGIEAARYKALGNSWAVNCARWIGVRIAMVDALPKGVQS